MALPHRFTTRHHRIELNTEVTVAAVDPVRSREPRTQYLVLAANAPTNMKKARKKERRHMLAGSVISAIGIVMMIAAVAMNGQQRHLSISDVAGQLVLLAIAAGIAVALLGIWVVKKGDLEYPFELFGHTVHAGTGNNPLASTLFDHLDSQGRYRIMRATDGINDPHVIAAVVEIVARDYAAVARAEQRQRTNDAFERAESLLRDSDERE